MEAYNSQIIYAVPKLPVLNPRLSPWVKIKAACNKSLLMVKFIHVNLRIGLD